MIQEMKDLGFANYQITIDGDPSHHNKVRFNQKVKDSFTLILTNIVTIAQVLPSAEITLRFNYTAQNLSQEMPVEVDKIIGPVKSSIKLMFRKVWQEQETSELNETLRKVMLQFVKMGYNIIHDYDDFKLTSCYVEKSHYNAVFPDGTVDKCSNRDLLSTRGRLQEDGDIFWNEMPTETRHNVFDEPSECKDCVYLPLCMGPCPRNRSQLTEDGRICCQHANKHEYFKDEILNYVTLKQLQQ